MQLLFFFFLVSFTLYISVTFQHDGITFTDKGALQESRSCVFRRGQHSHQRRGHRWTCQVLWCGGRSHWNVCVNITGKHALEITVWFWHYPSICSKTFTPPYAYFRTRKAMGGSMTFKTALTERLSIIRCSREQVNKLITDHPPQLTPGIRWGFHVGHSLDLVPPLNKEKNQCGLTYINSLFLYIYSVLFEQVSLIVGAENLNLVDISCWGYLLKEEEMVILGIHLTVFLKHNCDLYLLVIYTRNKKIGLEFKPSSTAWSSTVNVPNSISVP